MAIQVTCESCGGTDTVAAKRDAVCGGCGMTLCQSCVDVFDHWGDGFHGSGDPSEAVAELRRAGTEAAGLAARHRELRKAVDRALFCYGADRCALDLAMKELERVYLAETEEVPRG